MSSSSSDSSLSNKSSPSSQESVMKWLAGSVPIPKWLKSFPGGEKLMERAISICESEVSRIRGLEDEIERLKRTVDRINSLLIDAEERRHIEDQSVFLWLRQLKSVSFDSDDLLDHYQTHLLVYKQNSTSGSSDPAPSRKRKRLWMDWELLQRRSFAVEIDKINKKLEDINKGRTNLRLRRDDGRIRDLPLRERPHIHLSGASHDRPQIFGRVEEMDEIVRVLMSDDLRGSLPVVPIYGAAGIGKSTLARLVYNDQRLDTYFNMKIWVDLNDGCDAVKATKAIYKEMTQRNCDSWSLNNVQDRLRGHLKTRENNKFLLVIDNLWNERFDFWEIIRVPLLVGAEGSKVLVTTRNERASRIMSALPRPALKGLEDDICWDLLRSLALPQGIEEHHKHLVPIGKEIAKNCNGSPLAAKTLGALLNGRDEEEWSNVLAEMRALDHDQNGVLPSLKISYHHLPYNIKQCFAYCSIFPSGYLFEKDQVIRYWMAEGLIKHEGRRRLEAVGFKYFDELLWRSFFEKTPVCDKSQREKYRMPSLMHNIAKHVADYEFVGLESDVSLQSEPGRARYAYLLHRQEQRPVIFDKTYPYTNLRTLKICGEYGKILGALNSIPRDLFSQLKCLRVLDLSNSELRELPDLVSELIHLRYLGLSNTLIQELPEKVCDLYNLQTIELGDCSSVKKLPKETSKLVNLRHLGLHLEWEQITDSSVVEIPHGIGKLTSLQMLSRFNVIYDANGNCNLRELRDLNSLRGELCILNLEKVANGDDAKEANLGGKQFIENLMLRWNESARTDYLQWRDSKIVIESLKPHNRLKNLWIRNYPGTHFPDWMGDRDFSSLDTVTISACRNFNFLAILGKLPRLKNLHVEKIDRITNMDKLEGFSSLEILIVAHMPDLNKWSQDVELPKIKEIDIHDCANLQELALHRDLIPKLKRWNCPTSTRVVSL